VALLCAAAAASAAGTGRAPRHPDHWKTLELGSARAAAGQKVRGALSVLETVDGTPFAIPVVIASGTRPGPVVWVQALAHGDEYGGARALQELVRDLDPGAMSGAVIAVMVANAPAFQGLQRVNPNLDDLTDLGNTWPGKPHGFASERLAAAYFKEITDKADYFLDLHTGGDRFRQVPFILYTQTGKVDADRLDDLAMSFGLPTLWRDTVKVFSADPLSVMTNEGIPAFLVEVGGGQPLLDSDIRMQADAVRSFLRHVGVLPGSPAWLRKYLVVTQYQIVTNRRGGFFEPSVKLGQRIQGGSVIGVIRDVHGDVVETMRAPSESEIVIGLNTYPAWPSGGWLYEMGSGLYEIKPPPAPRR
jgi:predicted deacylase